MSGFVSLVGAGPGDVELLTMKAVRRLEQADLVLYDALASAEAVNIARSAQRFFVGKRARKKSVRQETIHKLMIRAAKAGKRVVRLKGGDPFVLGRGGEECLALAKAGIAFEVIPGVSSAVAAPGLAGIPVTHRGLAAGFAVLSGHAEESFSAAVDSLAPNALTLVVLMGVKTRSTLAQRLLKRGWDPQTPAALLFAASTPRASSWVGTLQGLAVEDLPDTALSGDDPGTLVIGPVVSLAEQIFKGVELGEVKHGSQRRP